MSAVPLADESWQVKLDNGEERVYKGVVVCNGHHWDKRMPEYPGRFTGTLIHSKDYEEPRQLQDKRVLVIGGGNSGCDIACEGGARRRLLRLEPAVGLLVPAQDRVRHAAHRSAHLGAAGVRAAAHPARRWCGSSSATTAPMGSSGPSHKLFERHPAFGTDVLNYLRQGRIKPRPDIARFAGTKVHFTDGSAGEYDMIVAATGFYNSFPFLPKGLVPVENDVVHVYGGAFPEAVKNLYIVGWAQARNGFGSLITPAAKLYADMIAMQDEIELPIGYVLKWRGLKVPTTNLVNPAATRRVIRLTHYLLAAAAPPRPHPRREGAARAVRSRVLRARCRRAARSPSTA